MAVDDTAMPATIDPDPDEEPSARERIATLIERRLDLPMAGLALIWLAFVAYELIAPREQRDALTLAGNIIWAVFGVEFALKLIVSGKPLRYLRRHWPSVLFLVLPALRLLRVVRAIRVLRILPAARVIGSSYRAVGTARTLLEGRLAFLVTTTLIVIVGGAQLLFLVERGRPDGVTALGDAIWWAANVAVSGNMVFEPVSLAGRLLGVALAAYALVVFASVAAALGAFFVESRQERATLE